MSYKNPNYREILERSSGDIGEHFGKSYANLAKGAFYRQFKRRATLDDCQWLRDYFEDQWGDYYSPEKIAQRKRESDEILKNFTLCSNNFYSPHGPYQEFI
jgi:hypothetical protein